MTEDWSFCLCESGPMASGQAHAGAPCWHVKSGADHQACRPLLPTAIFKTKIIVEQHLERSLEQHNVN